MDILDAIPNYTVSSWKLNLLSHGVFLSKVGNGGS